MLKNNKIVLVLCPPVMDLHKKWPSIVTRPQIGEIPLGILYLAAELEKHGFDVVIKDNTLKPVSNYEFACDILSEEPGLVGFSLLALNVRSTRDTARLLKNVNPDIVVVFGGPHATLTSEQQANFAFVDVVVSGMGEISLREIAEAVRANSFQVQSIPEKKVILGKIPDSIDEIALPARHLIDITKYRRKSYILKIEPVDFMTTSRGCPFSCSFCSSKIFWKNRYYKRTPKFVVDEIEKLIFEYGSKGIYFREDNFTVDKKHVIGICDEIISRNIKIEWECESRVDTIDRDVLKRMKEAGCTAIWCGVESGCQKTLDSIKKGYSLSDVRRFVKWCNELNIEIGTCYMLGFPDETIEDIRETFNFAKTLEVKWSSFATYFGFPLSELYEELLRNSLWEDKWEDVYIARNKQLTSAQLYYLEAAMNRDIRKYNQNYNETGIPAYKYYIVKIRQCFLHPIYVFNRIKTRFHINKKNINSRLSFNKLVDKFKKEKHESNP